MHASAVYSAKLSARQLRNLEGNSIFSSEGIPPYYRKSNYDFCSGIATCSTTISAVPVDDAHPTTQEPLLRSVLGRMNRGNIPGYYYDEEKQKYFKIQANHQVPLGAKYAKSSVKQEKRSTKKRKIENDKMAWREKQTIRKAPVLKSAVIGGIGLEREHALHVKSGRNMMQRESATISQWEPEWLEIKLARSSSDTRLQNAHYIPERETMVMTVADAHSGASRLIACMWWWKISTDGVPRVFLNEETARGVIAFNSTISTLSSVRVAQTTRILACAEQHQTGNIAMISLPEDEEDLPTPKALFTCGKPGSSVAESSIHPTTGNAAIIGTCGIFIIDSQMKPVNSRPPSRPDWPRCEPCVNWLDVNTVVYGAKPDRGHSIMLWDVRTRAGTTARFNVRERLTGVFNPTKYGHQGLGDEHQILASTNHRIDLFDTRMPNASTTNAPVLSFPHVHGGPRLQRAAYGGLVAAVDAENIVQVYSIRTGTKVRSLKPPEWTPRRLESPVLRHLQWYDHTNSGSMLQAVRGNGIVRWIWGGGDEEVDEG